jgi:membrane peptidoglycan carboxypeptidase
VEAESIVDSQDRAQAPLPDDSQFQDAHLSANGHNGSGADGRGPAEHNDSAAERLTSQGDAPGSTNPSAHADTGSDGHNRVNWHDGHYGNNFFDEVDDHEADVVPVLASAGGFHADGGGNGARYSGYHPPARAVSATLRGSFYRVRRRRRHFSHYLTRTARERQLARARTMVRAAWASAIIMALAVLAIVTSSVSAAATYYQSQAGLLGSLNRKIAAQDSVRIYDSAGTLLYQFNDQGAQHSIPLANTPVVVVNATVATEDKDFWINQGVDFQAIARAAYTDATSGHIEEGASTITQQLIKQNVLTSDPTFDRKIKEAILALGLTTQGVFTKAQILEMYLNSIPYGPTVYGIDAAATAYFGYTDNPATGTTAAQHLDLAQASLLAGIPQSPIVNDPLDGASGFQHARDRQQIVLSDMVVQGYITQAQADAAWKEAGQPNFFHPQYEQQDLAPHFVYYVQQVLDQMVTTGQLGDISRSGLNVYTTLDLDLQNHVQQYMIDHLCGNDVNDYHAYPIYIRDDNVTNASAVMVDQHNGDLKVLLGSIDYYGTKNCHKGVDGKFDVATQGYRGPGSSFKPIVYATAFEKGWFPALTLGNEPTVFWDAGAGKPYEPMNADNNHLAPAITIRNALQLSQNIPAVKTMQFAGIDDVEANAERFGITSWLGTWGLSSALGTLQIHLFDFVQAYTVFANYGQYIPIHTINRITDSAGDVLFQYHVPQPVRVLSSQVAFLITSILSDNLARAPEFGRCSVLYLDPNSDDCYYFHGNSPNVWPAAAKTGTGQDLTDDWTMGYTMDYTMGVWVGNNDFSNMRWVDGVTGAAPIWYHSMLYAEHNLPKTPFPVPSGVHRATYTSDGVTSTDWFINGTTPPPNIGNSNFS